MYFIILNFKNKFNKNRYKLLYTIPDKKSLDKAYFTTYMAIFEELYLY